MKLLLLEASGIISFFNLKMLRNLSQSGCVQKLEL